MFSYNTRLRTRARFTSQPLYFLNAGAGGSSEIISMFYRIVSFTKKM